MLLQRISDKENTVIHYPFVSVIIPVRNEAEIRIDPELDLQGVLDYYAVPIEQCYLVLVNGVYVPPNDREGYMLSECDALAVCRYV